MTQKLIYSILICVICLYSSKGLYAQNVDPYIVHELHTLLKAKELRRMRIILENHRQYIDNAFNEKGHSLLHVAAYMAYKEAVELLLFLGADVNIQHPGSLVTPLHLSTNPEITYILAHAPNVDLNARSHKDFSPLMVQLKSYSDLTAENIHVLLEAGADASDTLPETGSTPLTVLFDRRHIQYQLAKSPEEIQELDELRVRIAADLIAHGADVNTPTAVGITPLHFAAKSNNVPAIHFLVSRGAKINATDKDYQRTPVGYALFEQSTEAFVALTELGAQWNIPDHRNTTVTDILEQESHKGRVYYQNLLALRDDNQDNTYTDDESHLDYTFCSKFVTQKQRQIRRDGLERKRRFF